MTILIANIGTSDLAIQLKIDNETRYLPIEFLAEPNLKKQIAKIPEDLQKIWNQQTHFIQNLLYPELQLACDRKQRSRDITELLLQDYDQWHSRLSFVRIGGVLKKAHQLGAKKAYILVTDQKNEQMSTGHEKDTVFLYELLNRWLHRQEFNLELEPQFIPGDKNANDLEPMLDFYETTLADILRKEGLNRPNSDNELVLVSIKGGTGAMVTALQLQGMDAGFKNLVFIDPELSLERILAGEFSECKLTLYWRQLQSQKYRIVRQLLGRWDFDGAIQVLADWEKTLEVVPNEVKQQVDLDATLEKLKTAIATLEVGVCFFNLDRAGAKTIIGDRLSHELKSWESDYNAWFNLYEQCRIYWELNQVANCLARMTSFWEDSLIYLMLKLGAELYLTGELSNWDLDKNKVEPELWEPFAKKEAKKNSNFKTWDFDKKPYRLISRFSKQRFAEAMIKFQQKDTTLWNSIKDSLTKKLNYWVERRNDLIHRTEGISKTTMQEMLEADRAAGNQNAIAACEPDEILPQMANICCQTVKLLQGADATVPIGIDANAPHYIYSAIIDKVLSELQIERG